jgi:uncharacterized membrane protein
MRMRIIPVNIPSRIWEIDFLRGIAVIMMIMFHLVVDLTDFYGYHLNYLSGFWYYEGKVTAMLFMLLAGTSTVFSKNITRRGLVVFGWGMILTVITYLYDPTTYIRFGILHFLGCCLLLYCFADAMENRWIILLAVLTIALGDVAAEISVTSEWLVPLGITPTGYKTLDYYPLVPWAGVFLLGVLVGRGMYMQPRSMLPMMPHSCVITYVGRHSLFIYLVHQPILLAILYAISLIVHKFVV